MKCLFIVKWFVCFTITPQKKQCSSQGNCWLIDPSLLVLWYNDKNKYTLPVQNYSRESNPFEYCLFGLLIQFIGICLKKSTRMLFDYTATKGSSTHLHLWSERRHFPRQREQIHKPEDCCFPFPCSFIVSKVGSSLITYYPPLPDCRLGRCSPVLISLCTTAAKEITDHLRASAV